jgi:hypothetical protein
MKWVMIIVFMWGRYPAIERVEGFADRKDCVLASQEMRASFKSQVGGWTGGPVVLTHCMKVGR